MGQAENSVMYAVEQVCGLYGVQVTREQSRQFNVQGAAGRWRPMFFGSWTDEFGKKHNKGKPDFLARPRVVVGDEMPESVKKRRLSIPLWIECKSKTGKPTHDQLAFARWVQKNGDAYLLLVEDVRPLIAWFDQHGVSKQCDEVALATVVTPLDAGLLNALPCKWCGFGRGEHMGKMLSCPLHLAACNTKLIGKVWSPDLRKGAKHAAIGTSISPKDQGNAV